MGGVVSSIVRPIAKVAKSVFKTPELPDATVATAQAAAAPPPGLVAPENSTTAAEARDEAEREARRKAGRGAADTIKSGSSLGDPTAATTAKRVLGIG